MEINEIKNDSANENKMERILPMGLLKHHYNCLMGAYRKLKGDLTAGNLEEKDYRVKKADYEHLQEGMRHTLSIIGVGNYTEGEAANGFVNFSRSDE